MPGVSTEQTVFLHIGVHKTGTTAIQVLFSRAREALLTEGVLYPMAGRPKDPRYSFGHHELPWHMIGRSVSSATILSDLREEIALSSASKVVLSSEEFDRLTDEQASAFTRALPGGKKVVFYYRRQADVLQGLYGTEICFNREARPIAEFIAAIESELNYLTLARRWAEIVGAENVIARPYDRWLFAKGNVVEDFCAAVSVVLPSESSARTEWNESLPNHAARSVQQLWKLGVPAETVYLVIRSLKIAFRGQKTNYQFLSPSERRAIDDRFREDNERFLREFAPGQPDTFSVKEVQTDAEWQSGQKDAISALTLTLTGVANSILEKR